jgi:Tol biopolymer transport system component
MGYGASGSSPLAQALIASTVNDSEARYSPDGTQIVFSSNRSGYVFGDARLDAMLRQHCAGSLRL